MITSIPIKDAPITYYPTFVKDPDNIFVNLRDNLDWEQRDAPRQEYYCNDFPEPYVYGRGEGRRTYLTRSYHPDITSIRQELEGLTGTVFEVCFLNRYLTQKNSLHWHSDDSIEMDDERPIGIVSLGEEREIWFRLKNQENNSVVEKIKLAHGSLCLMHAGMQDIWEHRIPKASFICGERISLTFRGFKVL